MKYIHSKMEGYAVSRLSQLQTFLKILLMLWHYCSRKVAELTGAIIKIKIRKLAVATAFGSILSGVFYFTVNSCENVKMAIKTDNRHLSLEEKFRAFASLQFNGVLLMTPSDFLRSLVDDQKPVKMLVTNDSEFIQKLMKKASRKKYEPHFFSNLQNDGIITFSEYLFLLHILTSLNISNNGCFSESSSGFEIAFKMLDRDLSGSVDAREFMILNHIIAESTKDISADDREICDLLLPEDHAYNTTLMTHLFGYNKTHSLSFDEFKRFMQDVQTEALEVEFQQFSSGTGLINPVDFARIILRYTTVSSSEYDAFINRIEKSIPSNITIPFAEFQKFFTFLNCLDDFALAIKMYTIAGKPISLPEFKRAVKACIGNELSSDILSILFALFDNDDDNCLSYHEFIHIMRERHSGGLSRTAKNSHFAKIFRKCLKRELQSAVN
ncbi:Calcium uptake protein 2, mitochondrial [Schistosoma japonicum]|nr:Calcium uptake protein 2, mitochondrial [Schistosoma japonicum]